MIDHNLHVVKRYIVSNISLVVQKFDAQILLLYFFLV